MSFTIVEHASRRLTLSIVLVLVGTMFAASVYQRISPTQASAYKRRAG
jgi:hypothetical protein